jgi:hypothetical protein
VQLTSKAGVNIGRLCRVTEFADQQSRESRGGGASDDDSRDQTRDRADDGY